jgi:NADH-quinone oxidoreductase subunit N
MTPAQINLESLFSISPILALLGLASMSLLMEVYFKEKGRIFNGQLCSLGILATFILVTYLLLSADLAHFKPFAGSILFDRFSLFCALIFLIAAGLSVFLQIDDEDVRCGEVYCLTLLATVGMMVMASGMDFFTIFMGLEVMSLSVYALAGIKRTDLFSNEASLKYFILGAFSSGLFLYGIALCYGATGSVYLTSVASTLNSQGGNSLLLMAGMVLILGGFAFKVALVPFHMWAPDVYEGSPTPITAFMATGVKAASFVAFIRVFIIAFPALYMDWSRILWILALLTMIVGNVVALAQKSLKRMLSYSSIAHAGYLLLAVLASRSGNERLAVSSLLFYLLSYTFMTAGAFTIVSFMDRFSEGEDRIRYGGLGWRRPWVAGSMAVFLLSLAGIPPTAGFFAKFYVFSAALKAEYYGLVVLAVINSAISLYYYLRPIVWMYMSEGARISPLAKVRVPYYVSLVLIATVVGSLWLGLFPMGSNQWVEEAANALLPVSSFAAKYNGL